MKCSPRYYLSNIQVAMTFLEQQAGTTDGELWTELNDVPWDRHYLYSTLD